MFIFGFVLSAAVAVVLNKQYAHRILSCEHGDPSLIIVRIFSCLSSVQNLHATSSTAQL